MPKLKVPGEEHQPSSPSGVLSTDISTDDHPSTPEPKKEGISKPGSTDNQSTNEEGLKNFYAIFGQSDEEVTRFVFVLATSFSHAQR